MQKFDWLMGSAAIAVGLAIAASAVAGARWLMESRRSKWLIATFGPVTARALLVGIGLVFIALGGVIFSGWRPPWAR